MRKVAIMQPTYLPWAGYFNLISNSDVFVFLDDVKFSRSSWQHRNKILVDGNELLLTVPVKKKGKYIDEIVVNDQINWRKKHLRSIIQSYNKHPFGKDVIEIVECILKNENLVYISEINIKLITNICDRLGIETKFIKSSDLKITGYKSEYVKNICDNLGADIYLSAKGSKEYIERDGLFTDSNMEVVYQDFIPENYTQYNTDCFIPYLSIIDLISNLGFYDSQKHIDTRIKL